MPNIAPNSTVRLLSNCPLDKTYDHTIYFASRSAQTTYFQNLTKSGMVFGANSYTRKDRGLKIQAPVGTTLYDCNYIMFKNTDFENKWFYAFITRVEYINNLTWEVDIEIDDMQTWMFDYEVEKCFVEREHSETDELFENLVPEKLETGEYISNGITRCANNNIDTGSSTSSILSDYSLVFACTFNRNYADYHGGVYTGLYSGLCLIDFPFPSEMTTANINTFVTNVRNWVDGAVQQGKTNGFMSAFVMPTNLIHSDTSPATTEGFTKTATFNKIDGYTPKNKKLFSYPYNFLYVTNFEGQSASYMFEYFDTPTSMGFSLESVYCPIPEVILSPLNYKGSSLQNYDERMVIGKYPQLPFATDTWQAWMSMDASGQILSAVGRAGAGALIGSIVPGIGTVAGAVAGGLAGIVSSIGGMIGQSYEKDIAPPQNQGSTAGSYGMCANKLIDFGFMHKHIRAEFAEIIDDYFNMFGYATHRCKVPNTHVRPHWTYTKTVGCCIVGSVPADSARHICQIYDKGITFWMNGSEVGHYELDNRPT